MKEKMSSGGHKLGQIIGDWFEEYFAMNILQEIADDLDLYLDSRFIKRDCRGEKIIWKDLDGNGVDYDFVLELNGDNEKFGTPLAFFETFWRRGARHSKDKARDDSGKLLPMRATYPTSRILGIISAGDFTKPAQELVKSRSIDLFYIPKQKIINAWKKHNVIIDYPDTLNENNKQKLVLQVIKKVNEVHILADTACELEKIIGKSVIDNYQSRIKSMISAPPISYGIANNFREEVKEFEDFSEVTSHLENLNHLKNIASSNFLDYKHSIHYQAIYSDGNIFERDDISIMKAIELHKQIGNTLNHFRNLDT